MSEDHRQHLGGLLSGNPDICVTIDLGDLQVRAGDDLFPVDFRAGARDSLMNGIWDPLDELLLKSEQVDQLSKSLHYI